MYYDYKGFVQADMNVHSNGTGFFTLEDYAKKKMSNSKYSKFIGVNLNISNNGEFTIYFILEDEVGEVVKHELKAVNEKIFREVFNGVSMMIYDKNVTSIEKLKNVHVLETLQIR